jgi:hypothetical protein
LSSIKYNKSKRDNKGGGKLTFSGTERSISYFELIGLAQAKIEVLAFRVVIIPALATDIVCCSYRLKLIF